MATGATGPVSVRPTLLEEALEAWSYTRQGVMAELENLPADRLDFRPREGMRSVAELVLHIAESGMMMSGELSRVDGDFQRQPYPDFIAEHVGEIERPDSRAGLLALLRTTQEKGADRLRDAGDIAMLQLIRRFDGEYGTRLAWLNHGIEHESYHRGQLAHYARFMGLVPALTQRIGG